MKKHVKIIIATLLAVAAAATTVYAFTAPISIETLTLEPTDAKITFTEQGDYAYTKRMTVFAQVAGEVTQVLAKEGVAVKKGDVLAVVSADDYDYEIRQLESAIAGYEAQIKSAEAQNAEARTTLEAARRELAGAVSQAQANIDDIEKSEEALKNQLDLQSDIIVANKNVVNALREDYRIAREDYRASDEDETYQQIYDEARKAYNQAQAVLLASEQQFEQMKTGIAGRDSLEAQKKSLEDQLSLIGGRVQASAQNTESMRQLYNAQIEAARQSIANLTEKREDTSIVAPIDGVAERLPVEEANVVTQASPVAQLASNLAVEVYVPLREIDGVKPGDTVELIATKRDTDEITLGTVREIDGKAEIKVSALGVEERKVRVRITPKQPDAFKPGYAMDVRFTVKQLTGAVVVPKTAVFELEGQDTVWVLEDGAARYRTVQKGLETREGFEISAGLAAGERIIPDANTAGLSPGKRVK